MNGGDSRAARPRLGFPLVESKKLRQARRESLTDWTSATLGTSDSQDPSLPTWVEAPCP